MKKILIITLVVILLCAMAISTTSSYFIDTAYDANTMTVGNVSIEQYEMYRNDGALASWGAGYEPALLPAVGVKEESQKIPELGTYQLVTGANVLDKIVYVQNTGNEAAFLRTLFAFEMLPVKDGDQVTGWTDPVKDGLVIPVYNQNGGTWDITNCEFEKDGVRYVVYSYTYTAALQAATPATPPTTTVAGSDDPAAVAETLPASYSAPSLLQVYLASKVGNEFFEAVGEDYNILILSQAVQATDFENVQEAFAATFAYGTKGENVPGWFGVQPPTAGNEGGTNG